MLNLEATYCTQQKENQISTVISQYGRHHNKLDHYCNNNCDTHEYIVYQGVISEGLVGLGSGNKGEVG